MNGIFFIDKPKGLTSREVVDAIVRKTETTKVGHTGTLDPVATGVLIVCVGRATKLVDLLTAHDKEYEACVTLGIETDTLDDTGTVCKEESVSVTEKEIDEVLEKFQGNYLQEVPKYSAVKVNGRKLYEYAREKKEVTLPKREVTIYSLKRISALEEKDGKVSFWIRTSVSKGTYIRSLIRDIAYSLKTVGIMKELKRTKQGEISIQDCTPLDDIHLTDLKPLHVVLKDMFSVTCDETLKKEVLNGRILVNTYHQKHIVFKDEEGAILAIYKVYEKDTSKIKPDVMIGGIV